MSLFNVDADISVRLTLGANSYTICNGDLITNMTVTGLESPVSGQVVEIGVIPTKFQRNDHTAYDSIPVHANETILCRMVRGFNQMVQVTELVIHDPTTCVHHHVKIDDIVSIESLTPGRVVLKSGDSIADAIDDLKDGQYIYLEAGEYEEDLTLTSGVVIVGAGNGIATLKGSVVVNMTDTKDYAVIGDVKITDAAAANTGMVTVKAGNLQLINDVLVVTGAKGIAECSAVNRAVTAATVTNKILIENCTIDILGGEAKDKNYGVSIGTASGTDLGALTMSVVDTVINANYIGIYCTARGLVNLSVVRSKFTGFGAFYMNHNGETATAGTFDASFAGSSVGFIDSKLVGTQYNVASLDSDGCDCNTFATLAVSNTKNLKLSVDKSVVKANMDKSVVLTGGAKYAPMYALQIDDKSTGVLVRMNTVTIHMNDPVVECEQLNGNPTYCGVDMHNVKVLGLGARGGSYPFYAG